MKSSDLAGGAKGEEEYDRTENEQDRGTAGAVSYTHLTLPTIA